MGLHPSPDHDVIRPDHDAQLVSLLHELILCSGRLVSGRRTPDGTSASSERREGSGFLPVGPDEVFLTSWDRVTEQYSPRPACGIPPSRAGHHGGHEPAHRQPAVGPDIARGGGRSGSVMVWARALLFEPDLRGPRTFSPTVPRSAAQVASSLRRRSNRVNEGGLIVFD